MPQDKTSEHLRAELKSLADTLEEVLQSSTDKPKAELDKLRAKAENALKDTRVRLSETSDKIAAQPKRSQLKRITTYMTIHGLAYVSVLLLAWC